MAGKKKVFYVTVTTLQGQVKTFQLPKDLQGPIRMYWHENPKDWQKFFLGALINIPLADYTAKNRYQPMITLARVTGFFYRHQLFSMITLGGLNAVFFGIITAGGGCGDRENWKRGN